jgi:hypothetical protein
LNKITPCDRESQYIEEVEKDNKKKKRFVDTAYAGYEFVNPNLVRKKCENHCTDEYHNPQVFLLESVHDFP